jgi:hypothetical protein
VVTPLAGFVIVEPILPSEARAAEVKARSGLLVAKPSNSGRSFEGLPNQCRVVALPKGYKGTVKRGKRYVMSEKSPQGFRHDGRVLFHLEQKQIIAEVIDD